MNHQPNSSQTHAAVGTVALSGGRHGFVYKKTAPLPMPIRLRHPNRPTRSPHPQPASRRPRAKTGFMRLIFS